MAKEWYAVRTFNGYEQKVIDNLKKQIVNEGMSNLITDIYLPVIKRYSFVRNKLKVKEELLFPGYIFVEMEMSNETVFFVRGVQYVTGYAGISSMKERPEPMEYGEVDRMKEETKKIQVDIEVGDTVKVVNHDMYDGQTLKVHSIIPEEEKIEVELGSILGDDQGTETISFLQIEKK